MVAILDRNYGYGKWGNPVKVRRMKKMNDSERRAFVKKLWQCILSLTIRKMELIIFLTLIRRFCFSSSVRGVL